MRIKEISDAFIAFAKMGAEDMLVEQNDTIKGVRKHRLESREIRIYILKKFISGKRINSAGCFLPNYSDPELNSSFGSRHRAAIGMSRSSDAGVIVVSEEDGKISYAFAGELFRGIDENTLRTILEKYYGLSGKKRKVGSMQ